MDDAENVLLCNLASAKGHLGQKDSAVWQCDGVVAGRLKGLVRKHTYVLAALDTSKVPIRNWPDSRELDNAGET